jgi:hypothetical protein
VLVFGLGGSDGGKGLGGFFHARCNASRCANWLVKRMRSHVDDVFVSEDGSYGVGGGKRLVFDCGDDDVELEESW